jgi:nucleoside-diphosphate-sugar epimerase
MKKLNIMILGGSGRLGTTLITSFQASGHSVMTHSIRNWSKNSVTLLPNRSIDIVIHAANPEYPDWNKQALAMTETAIAIAKHYDASLMFPGNVYNFGQAMPFDLKTSTLQAAENEKGLIRVAQEQALQNATRNGLRCIVIRAGDFFGAGKGNWFDLVITKKINQQKVCYPGPTDRLHAWAYLPDLAEYFVQIAAAKEILKPLEIIHFEGHTCSGNKLIEALEEVVGKKLFRTTFPWLLIKIFQVFIRNAKSIIEMKYLWQVPHRLCNESTHKPKQNTPLIKALRNTLNHNPLHR